MITENLSQEQKIGTLKKIFSEDIELFGKYFFPHHLSLATPPFHREIYDAYESSSLRIAIGAPRGHAKSTITDLVYLAWAIIHGKAHFVLLVSDTYSQSTLFLEALKAEFEENEKLRMFYGNLVSKSWAEDEIISNGVMVKCLGAGMKVRGLKFRENRPDLIIVDDLENDDLVSSKDRRDKLKRWFNGALIPSLGKGGRLVMIGTILHYDSLMSEVLDPKKYTEFYKKTYKAIDEGKALWPEHLSLAELDQIKKNYIEQGQGYLFYQEYQNDPVSDEHRKFKIEQLKYFTEKDIEGKRLRCFITIDRAYSAEKTSDFTGIIVNRVDTENNWYVRSERFRGNEKDLINKIFDLKSYFNPVKIGIEQKAFEYTLKPYLTEEMRRRNSFFSITELKDANVAKIRRIEGLLPRYESGAMYFLKGQTDIIDELIRFPKGVHDDLIDALAYQNEVARGGTVGNNERKKFIENFDYYTKRQPADKPYFTGSLYLRR
jgi:phage terminase large subunit-like protein